MYRIIHLIMGCLCLSLKGEAVLTAVGTVTEEGFHLGGFAPEGEGYKATCSIFGADRLIVRLEELGVGVEVVGKKGLPFRTMGYLRRPGLIVGLGIALLLLFSSTRLIWDVRPQCQGEFDEKEVLADLKSLGVYPGAKLYSLDVYEAEQKFLIENTDYSDIAINIQGTVATVKLRRRTNVVHRTEETAPCNIIAAEAGVIRKITAVKGEPAVESGDTVAAGDLLIKGEVTGKHGAIYMYRAEGSVMALVYREYTVTIPLETEEKHYTGKKETKTLYTALGGELPLFRDEKCSFMYADAERHREKLVLFGQLLPVVKETVTYKEYEMRPVTLTVGEAKERAIAAFDGYLEREVEGEVLKKSTDCTYSKELNAIVLSGIAEVAAEIGTAVDIKPLG